MRVLKYASMLTAVSVLLSFSSFNVQAQSDDEAIEEIVVTGSYIKRRNQQDLSSPLNTVGLEDIEANGWTDLEDVAETFTFSPSNYGRGGLRNGCCGSARAIELRGLGVSSTLVLLNGKRSASTWTGPAGADYTNIKQLVPMIAVDRIETLLDGGAALYGSDAVAGVVNMMTRTDFEGVEVRVGGKQIDNSGQQEVQFIVGGGNDQFHGMFAFAYERQDHMWNKDRPFNLINNTSSTGMPGTYFTTQRPVSATGGDVIIDNGVNDPVNYSTLFDHSVAGTGPYADIGPNAAGGMSFADPYCLPEAGPAIGPVPGGGQFAPSYDGAPFPVGICRSSYQPYNSITPHENNYSFYTHWTMDLNESNQLSLEASFVRTQDHTFFVATFPQTNGKPIVPADHPANELGVPLTWTGRAMGIAYGDPHGSTKSDGDTTSNRVAFTWDGDFAQFTDADWADTWSFNVTAQYSDQRRYGENPDTDLRRIQNALNGFGGPNCQIRFDGPAASETAGGGNCYYYSPFAKDIYGTFGDYNSAFTAIMDADGTPLSGNDNVLDVLRFAAQTDGTGEAFERSLTVIQGLVTGDLFELPGGYAGLAIGLQHRRQIRERQVPNFQTNFAQGFLTPRLGGKGGRSVDAYFAELFLPIHEAVDIQLAVRTEDYGEVDSTDPKIGINWRIMDNLTARFSAGTSFRAPSLGNVVGNDASSYVAQVIDPINPAESDSAGTFRTIILTKNPNLEPEESENFNIGLSWSPELSWGDGSHELQIDADYFDFEFENQIRSEDVVQVVKADPCGPKVVRDPVNFLVGALPSDGPTACPSAVGELLLVNLGYFNSGQTTTNGFDISARYSLDLLGGRLTAMSETTVMNTYDIQVSDGGPILDGVGFSNDGNPGVAAPKLKTNLMLNYIRDAHSFNVTFRYIDEVEDDAFALRTADGKGQFGVIDSHNEVDIQYGYSFGDNQQYDFKVGAINVGDKEPPATFFRGYSEELHNPYMRQLYVRFSASM